MVAGSIAAVARRLTARRAALGGALGVAVVAAPVARATAGLPAAGALYMDSDAEVAGGAGDQNRLGLHRLLQGRAQAGGGTVTPIESVTRPSERLESLSWIWRVATSSRRFSARLRPSSSLVAGRMTANSSPP